MEFEISQLHPKLKGVLNQHAGLIEKLKVYMIEKRSICVIYIFTNLDPCHAIG